MSQEEARRRAGSGGPARGGHGPGFLGMIGLAAIIVATVILVFFGIGFLLGKIFL